MGGISAPEGSRAASVCPIHKVRESPTALTRSDTSWRWASWLGCTRWGRPEHAVGVGSLPSWLACHRDTDLMRRNLDLLIVIGCMLAAVIILPMVPR